MGRVVLAAWAVLAWAPVTMGGPITNDPQLVLDIDEGSFRMCMGWKTPTLITEDGKLKPLLWPVGRDGKTSPIPVKRSWVPPKNWMDLDFDDTYWPRTRGAAVIAQPARFASVTSSGSPAEWNLVFLRGKFWVTDPKKVMMPKLILRYYGGAVVYVNGKELQRGHLPKGKIRSRTLADQYPKETYVRPDGRLYSLNDKTNRDYLDRLAMRIRSIPPKGWLNAVAIPNAMLRKGVNVIAIEVHAAPVLELAVTAKAVPGGWKFGPQIWPHAGVVEAKVTTTTVSGRTPNVAPSAGIQISTCHPFETLRVYDYSHPCEKPAPISLVGARNGVHSGRVLVSSRETVSNLKATASELAQADGKAKIAADAIQVRYAEPANHHRREIVGWRRWPYFDRLLDQVPDEIKPVPMKIRGRNLQPIPTVLVPVWVTVRVPADAKPGDYEGKLTIGADGFGPVDVPIKLRVYNWRVPDPKDFRQTHGIYQSPDSVSLYYNVTPWSDKHFELMGKSFKLLEYVGSRIVAVPLIIDAPHFNNLQSMVRWIKQPDGSYQYDFTIMEKYLDLYQRTVGKPRILALYHGDFEGRTNERKPPKVNTFDPKTGTLGELGVPPYGTPENGAFWKPVFKELRARLEKRGWFDVAQLGHVSYCWAPTKETIKNYKAMWPDGKWISSCHGYRSNFGRMPVLCNEWVWGAGRHYNPDSTSRRYNVYPRPWRKQRAGAPIADLKIARGGFRDNHPLETYWGGPEWTLHIGLHGFGRLGGDFWPVRLGRSPRRIHLCDTAYALGHAINIISFISPGPNGAVSNERVEAFRQGHQIVEAIAYVREMLDQKKVTGDLAKRADKHLLDRARHFLRTGYRTMQHWMAYGSCGRHVLNRRLYALAAEIAEAAAKGQ